MNINFLKWEGEYNCLAPLTNKDRDSIIELTSSTCWRHISGDKANMKKSENESKIYPQNFKVDIFSDNDNELNKNNNGNIKQESKFGPITSSHQFLCLYAAVEEGMELEQFVSYQSYIAQLKIHHNECQTLLGQLDNALYNLKNLATQYTSVSMKTSALHRDCEHLLAEQTRLSNRADTIENKFTYFVEVSKLSEKLDSPTFNVTSDNFVTLLSKIDECTSYLKDNSTYLESANYLTRYKFCLNKALGMVKHYVIKSLENSTRQVNPHLGATNPTSANALILYYSKFRTNAPKIKALMSEIEDRSNICAEYDNLLTECHHCYFIQRKNLMEPCVSDAVNELLLKYSKNYCSLVRSSCAFLVHVCEDEYSLYHQFFSITSPELEVYLQGLCSILYDALRPIIIHIDHLETLSELCTILRKGMIEEHIQSNPIQLASLTTVVSQLLQDSQERLVYRAHMYIHSDIANYKPSSGDLAYPSKLELMESISDSLANQSNLNSTKSSVSSSVDLEENKSHCPLVGERFSRVGSSPADLHGMWYPTVRRTLMCLSKVYRCMDRNVFQGLSLDALSACMKSLSDAASFIKKNSSTMDAQLFEIKHLLILREQLTPFQVDANFREMSLDWSKLKSAAMGLVHKRGRLFSLTSNNSLLEFIVDGTPQLSEHIVDSRRNVDNQLKIVCEQFIAACNERLIGPLLAFENKAQEAISKNKDNASNASTIHNQSFSPEMIAELIAQVMKHIRQHIPMVQRSLQLYLANKDTEFILFKPIRNNIISAYTRLEQIIDELFSEPEKIIIACPTSDEIVALLSSLA